MKRTVILMTACINPKGMSFTKLQSCLERKKQYIEALHFYLQRTNFRIVFCNNSGEPLSELFPNKYKKRLEILSYFGNDYNVSLGKGHGELSIIKYAFQHSKFINEAEIVIKVTGRLKVLNLSEVYKVQKIVFGRRKDFVYADCSLTDSSDSRCFIASKSFYLNGLLNRKNNINDSIGYWFEHYLCDVIKCLPNYYVISNFILPLSICGQSGSTGDLYEARMMSLYQKMCSIRDNCQLNREKYMSNKLLYSRICFVSYSSRICKLFIKIFSSSPSEEFDKNRTVI